VIIASVFGAPMTVVMVMGVVVQMVVRLGHASMSHRIAAGSMRLGRSRPPNQDFGAACDV
jgi:hypothetical protein